MARPIKTKKEKTEELALLFEGKKKCSTCEKIKLIEEFPKQGSGVRRHCTVCYNDRRKMQRDPVKSRLTNNKSYKKHRSKRIRSVVNYNKLNKEKTKVWQAEFRKNRKEQYEQYKSGLSCSICGYDKHPKAIDLHHQDPSLKYKPVSKLIYSAIKLEEELKKCIPICANCHRILYD